jgi:hypothetical protein
MWMVRQNQGIKECEWCVRIKELLLYYDLYQAINVNCEDAIWTP